MNSSSLLSQYLVYILCLAFFRDFVDGSRPAVFRNLAKRSPAFHLWDDEYLKSLPGANETLVFVEPDLKENRSNVEGARDIPLLEFMEIYHTSPIYMVQGLPKILRYAGMMVLHFYYVRLVLDRGS